MTHQVRLASSAVRDLDRISPKVVPAIVEFMFGELAASPRRVGRPLRGELEGYFGARRGPYRIIYSIQDESVIVEVIRVDHRSDVYRSR